MANNPSASPHGADASLQSSAFTSPTLAEIWSDLNLDADLEYEDMLNILRNYQPLLTFLHPRCPADRFYFHANDGLFVIFRRPGYLFEVYPATPRIGNFNGKTIKNFLFYLEHIIKVCCQTLLSIICPDHVPKPSLIDTRKPWRYPQADHPYSEAYIG